MPGVNFKKLAHVQVLDVCAHLGLELKPNGVQYRGRCPICEHLSDRCFVVTPKLQRWWCFGHCRAGGDSIELYAQVRSLNKYNAALELLRLFPPN
jgi:hypothetical protein